VLHLKVLSRREQSKQLRRQEIKNHLPYQTSAALRRCFGSGHSGSESDKHVLTHGFFCWLFLATNHTSCPLPRK